MSKRKEDAAPVKSRSLRILEGVLLIVGLCVLALRATYTEAPTTHTGPFAGSPADTVYSLTLSGVLILSFVLWLTWSICTGALTYRRTGLEIGLLLLVIAAVVSCFAASDKRSAISSATMLIAPAVYAVLLVQLLRSRREITLVLIVIAALGLVSAYQCSEQFFISNQMTIEQFEEDPQVFLGPLGIEPGSFQHFMFEHRLYGRGIRGFFTTSNSAASFGVMALFAGVALFVSWITSRTSQRQHDSNENTRAVRLVLYIPAMLFLAGGLLLTRSKGGIVGGIFGAVLLVVFALVGRHIRAHRRAIVIFVLVLAVAAGGLVAAYGLRHGRLPGGNSMLVRWQYWRASAQMLADHPITGVGAGNFPHYYPHYKPDAALESVSDPHNVLLSVATQYGPLGLLAFALMIGIPLYQALRPAQTTTDTRQEKQKRPMRPLAVGALLVICFVLTVVRPLLMPLEMSGPFIAVFYGIVTLYVTPVAIFLLAFLGLAVPFIVIHGTEASSLRAEAVVIALFAAALGVVLHNLIDFAIFEPPVHTAFWMLIAALVAANAVRTGQSRGVFTPPAYARRLAPAGAVALIALLTATIWYPARVTARLLGEGYRSAAAGAYRLREYNKEMTTARSLPKSEAEATEQRARRHVDAANRAYAAAYALLEEAARKDHFSPAADALNGRAYLDQYRKTPHAPPSLLERATEHLREAIDRNRADYKNYERLAEVYALLGRDKDAYDTRLQAARLYPGCGRLWFKLGQAAEKLGDPNAAVRHYRRAVQIEDAYRAQFRIMYPKREKVVSRLGQENYDLAKERIQVLSQ